MDLMVYLAKYRSWIEDPKTSDTPDRANEILFETDRAPYRSAGFQQKASEMFLRARFESLWEAVEGKNSVRRSTILDEMLPEAYWLARFLDWKQSNATRSGNPEQG